MTPDVVLWHNPRCSKSLQALDILVARGAAPRIVRYLDEPPAPAEIDRVLALLGLEPRQLMRIKEEPYARLGLGDASRTREELVQAMSANPILIERPIAIRGTRAVIGRPPERVTEILART